MRFEQRKLKAKIEMSLYDFAPADFLSHNGSINRRLPFALS